MSLDTPVFIRRFLIHVLPRGFHRIRHYGLSANGGRAENLAMARTLLKVVTHNDVNDDGDDLALADWLGCPSCGQAMRIIEIFVLMAMRPVQRRTVEALLRDPRTPSLLDTQKQISPT